MGFEPVNYDSEKFQIDLTKLAAFDRKSRHPNFNLQDELAKSTSELFNTYNCCFSFYLLEKLEHLFSKKELDIQPYRSNVENLSLRYSEQVCFFEKPIPKTLCQSNRNPALNRFWRTFGGFPDTNYRFQFHKKMCFDLKEKNNFIKQLKESPSENFENLNNLLVLLGFYNTWLKFFLESLAARETLVLVYAESKNFPFFRKEIFQNILSLDALHDLISSDLLIFRIRYAELYNMIEKTNEKENNSKK